MNNKINVIYILGSGHCGSTLLNLLLNGHAKLIGLSEVKYISKYIDNNNLINNQFWQQVKQYYEKEFLKSFENINLYIPHKNDQIQDWAKTNANLFKSILFCSNADTVVDSSKDWKRLYLLQKSGLFNIKVIHLLRDGRGIFNSYYRKYGDFQLAFKRWLVPQLKAIFIRKYFSQNTWVKIHYETLATSPKTQLEEMCDYLGLEFEANMLDYKKNPYVGIGGNRMRKHSSDSIELDESWKQELSFWNSFKFNLLGGWLNKYYGY